VFFKGRLGEYKYYDMDDIIENALKFSKFLLKNIKN
jgi:UDP-galactopyranose mutase